jgi:hypothetical protein
MSFCFAVGESCTASFAVAGPGMMVAAKTITFALTEGSGAGAAISDLITVTAAARGFGIFTSVDVIFTSDPDNGSGLTAPPGATTIGAEMATQTINLGTYFPAVVFPATIEIRNDLEAGQIPEPSTLSIVAIALLAMGACGRPARSWLGRKTSQAGMITASRTSRHPGRAARSIENRECPKPATRDCEQH